jgi:hypothetical protein
MFGWGWTRSTPTLAAMATRFTVFCALAAFLTLPASALAQNAPSVSAPDMRPPQGTALSGPECGMASVQRRDYADAAGDSGSAPDLGAIAIDVREDCGVTITFATALAAGQSLTVGIDTDANPHTGLRDGGGADRILTVRDGQATLGIVDPAAGGVGSYVTPPVVRAGATTEVDTRVDALGLLPGRSALLTFSSAGTGTDADYAPEPTSTGFDLLVNFGNVAGETDAQSPARVALKGRAKVGRTLTCVAPPEMTRTSYRWLRAGRTIAKHRSLKLRKADGGRRVSCRVTGKLNGERATVNSAGIKVKR